MKDLKTSIVYKLKPSIRSKIFNYKEFTSSIDVYNNADVFPCKCNDSYFLNSDHGHIVTGDLRIVGNGKLRKLFVKGPNYREPSIIDFEKAEESITTGINEFIAKSSSKYKIHEREFSEWKQTFLKKINENIFLLQQKIKIRYKSKTLLDSNAKNVLDELKTRFV